jgi:hypothetical protein
MAARDIVSVCTFNFLCQAIAETGRSTFYITEGESVS